MQGVVGLGLVAVLFLGLPAWWLSKVFLNRPRQPTPIGKQMRANTLKANGTLCSGTSINPDKRRRLLLSHLEPIWRRLHQKDSERWTGSWRFRRASSTDELVGSLTKVVWPTRRNIQFKKFIDNEYVFFDSDVNFTVMIAPIVRPNLQCD